MSVHDETWDRPTCEHCKKEIPYGGKLSHMRKECLVMSAKTYTELEVKHIYADLIDQLGHDAGSVCNWSGVDSVSLEDWKKAWWKELQDYTAYEQEHGAYHERKRIAKELLEYNEPKY